MLRGFILYVQSRLYNCVENENVIDSPGRSQSLDLEKVCASIEYNNPVFTHRPDLEKIKKLSLSKQLEKNSRPNDSKS